MSAMDTARALKKLLSATLTVMKQGKDAGVRKLATELGKSHQFIFDHLNLLEESEEVVEWLKCYAEGCSSTV